ncbi:MAG: ABC transporter permease [Lachnospiraceae bacterium]|nr:ABC transporter permease [Lachnospiraceae bacterium]
MRNPLMKRLPREIRSEAVKYAAIFFLLAATISFVSGFLVADNSMIIAYNEGFTKYRVEDGRFRLDRKMNRAQKKAIEEFGVQLYAMYDWEETVQNGSVLRLYANRTQINLACVMEGRLPEKAGEVAIDRMYADNNALRVGDRLVGAHHSYEVVGFIALPDYSCLFADNSDSMFDAVKFGVGVVTQDAFDTFPTDQLHYTYSWRYNEPPADEAAERDLAEDLMELVNVRTHLETFVPRYENQAITFTGEDMGSDKAMMMVLLYIVIAILAFVFGITISNTIQQEACVIGTLRASGYTRMELVRHYMAMPLAVTLVAALVGNILGYTVLKEVCAAMYYGSYSLPTYVTIWNAEAFYLTTLVPVLLMAAITFLVLWRKLQLSPLQFLRRNLKGDTRRYALRLVTWIPFFTRFRIRVILQNMSNYIVLFIGILFANLLLMFGMMFPSVLAHFQETIEQNLLCEYQYLLQVPFEVLDDSHKLKSFLAALTFGMEVETDNPDAEKFSIYSLKTPEGYYKSETVLCYGVQKDSKYVHLEEPGQRVWISSAYAEKFDIGAGDQITLRETYEEDSYTFEVAGIYDYMGAVAVFMEQSYMNSVFDLGEDYFCGYLSATPITDIDDAYIGSVIDLEALTKISRQLDVSMGSMMILVDAFAVLIFIVLIFLLSKIIIEKNAQSISMTKILGYTNLEISRLYIVSTSFVVVAALLISLPIEYRIMLWLFKAVMLSSISGWIPFYLDPQIYVRMFLIGLVTYGVVAIAEYGKVRRIPMEEALKNVE